MKTRVIAAAAIALTLGEIDEVDRDGGRWLSSVDRVDTDPDMLLVVAWEEFS